MGVVFMKMKKKGFTLLEIVVVMAVLALLLPSVFGVIYIVMQQQLRIHKLTETKQQGDLIMNYMKESIIGSAVHIVDGTGTAQCETAGSSYADSTNFRFAIEEAISPRLISFQETGGALTFNQHTYIPFFATYTIDSISLNDPTTVEISNFTIECRRKTGNVSSAVYYPVVAFSYDATFVDNTPTAQEGIVTLHYQTKVKLRRTPD